MEPLNPASERIARNLQESIERLQREIARVEIWAGALAGFTKPVPGYGNAGTHRLKPEAK